MRHRYDPETKELAVRMFEKRRKEHSRVEEVGAECERPDRRRFPRICVA